MANAIRLSEVQEVNRAGVESERKRAIAAAIEAKAKEGIGVSLVSIPSFWNCLLEASAIIINAGAKQPAVDVTCKGLRGTLSNLLIPDYFHTEFACMAVQAGGGEN